MGTASVGNQRIWLTGEVVHDDLLAIANWYNSNFYGYSASYWGNSGRVTAADYNALLGSINSGAGSWWHTPSIPGQVGSGQRITGGQWFNAPTVTFSPFQAIWWQSGNPNSYTVPPGCNSITISALFGGGGGGGGGIQEENGGGGGGGGASSWVLGRTIGVSAGNVLNSNVGGPGTGRGVSSDGYSFSNGATAGGDSSVTINGNTAGYAHAGGPGGDAGPYSGGSGGGGGASDGGAGAGAGPNGDNGIEGGSHKTGHGKSNGGNGGGTPWGSGGAGGNSSNGWVGQLGTAEGCGGGGGGNNDGDSAQFWAGGNGQNGVSVVNLNS